MKQVNVKKLILPNIPYVFIALLATKVSEAVRLAPGSDASTKLLNIMTGLNTAFHSLVPSFHPIDLCVGVAAAIAIRLAVYIKGKNAKKFRKNLETREWNAVFRPVIMFSSFAEASEPGASRTASLTLVASSAMNTYGILGRMSFLTLTCFIVPAPSALSCPPQPPE
jgi:hypothetical protein